MTALERDIIERKLEFMRKYLKEIHGIVTRGRAAYLKDALLQAALERNIERVVEAAVDAASHILRSTFSVSATTYKDAILELGRRNAISGKLAEEFAPAAGLRNLIVHQYEEIDPRKVYAGAKKILDLGPKFMKAIEKFATR